MGRRLLWGVIGALGGVALAVGLAVAAAIIFDITQAEGAYAMGVAFFWTPLGALAGAIAGAVFAPRRRS